MLITGIPPTGGRSYSADMNVQTEPGTTPGRPPSITDERVAQLLDRITAEENGQPAKTVTTYAPYTATPIADIPQSSTEDVTTAFGLARAAQREWVKRPVADRARVVLKFHDLLLGRQDEAMDLIQWETGKARKHAFAEVMSPMVVARHYGRRARGILRTRRALGMFPGLTSVWALRRPKGVVGIISPWNYPFELGSADAIPALLAGNGVVSKPDTQTVLSVLWAQELMEEAGLPQRLWQIVAGDGPVIGPAVVGHADYVSFTGSTRTGRDVAQRAAANLTGVSLELGGKNPMIVLPDADLARTVAGAIDACFSSAGQLCISTERLYVHERLYDAFTQRFAEAAGTMRLAATYDFTADMGSLTTKAQLEKVSEHVEDAKAKGATVLAGGSPRPDVGPYFFEPTVLANVPQHATVCTEETFGPVVAVYKYRDVNEVIDRANNTPYGLNASVWTRDSRNGRRIAARLDAGTVNVNDGYAATYGSIGAPMGGMKNSGLGRRHGREGLLRFTEPQTIAVERLVIGVEPPLRRMSYDRWRRLLSRGLLTLKRIGVR